MHIPINGKKVRENDMVWHRHDQRFYKLLYQNITTPTITQLIIHTHALISDEEKQNSKFLKFATKRIRCSKANNCLKCKMSGAEGKKIRSLVKMPERARKGRRYENKLRRKIAKRKNTQHIIRSKTSERNAS